MRIKESLGRKTYIVVSTAIMLLVCAAMVLPLVKVVAESFSAKTFIENNQVLFWPKGFNIEAYVKVSNDSTMFRALKNSVFITVMHTALALLLTSTFAYALSREEFMGKKYILMMVTFTMIFTPPMIPNYLLIRNLKLDNTLWSVIIPGAVSGYNFYVMRAFFKGLPSEIIEAARIDGCSETATFTRIVLPLSKASLATVGLFYGVSSWNALQGPLIYLRKPELQTLQIKLYNVLNISNTDNPEISTIFFSPETIKMATIVIATLPILIIYPFLQKYFVKGATMGSVKE